MSKQGYETSKGLCRQANDYLQAAKRTCDNDGVPELLFPFYFLLARGLELALKAALLHDGVTVKELKKDYGHNLQALTMEFASRETWRSVEVRNQDLAIIQVMNVDYFAKRFEYRQARHEYRLPLPDMAFDVSQRLIKSIYEIIQSQK